VRAHIRAGRVIPRLLLLGALAAVVAGLCANCTWLLNRRPIAVLLASPASGEAPLSVEFDATSSYDPGGDRLLYEWNFGDGFESGNEIAYRGYPLPGEYTVELRVIDSHGRSATSAATLQVSEPKDVEENEWGFDASRGVQCDTGHGLVVSVAASDSSDLSTLRVAVDPTPQSSVEGLQIYSIYDITLDGSAQEANSIETRSDLDDSTCSVVLTFQMPEGEDPDAALIMEWTEEGWRPVSPATGDGIGGTLSADKRTMSVDLGHLSTYALGFVRHRSGYETVVIRGEPAEITDDGDIEYRVTLESAGTGGIKAGAWYKLAFYVAGLKQVSSDTDPLCCGATCEWCCLAPAEDKPLQFTSWGSGANGSMVLDPFDGLPFFLVDFGFRVVAGERMHWPYSSLDEIYADVELIAEGVAGQVVWATTKALGNELIKDFAITSWVRSVWSWLKKLNRAVTFAHFMSASKLLIDTYAHLLYLRDTGVIQYDITMSSSPDVGVQPSDATVHAGGQIDFDATLMSRGQLLTARSDWHWRVSGGGTIDENGCFTANTTAQGTYTVTATTSVFGSEGKFIDVSGEASVVVGSVSPSDLTVPVVMAPPAASAGDTVSVEFDISNQGGTTARDFECRLYLSATPWGTDELVSTLVWPAILPLDSGLTLGQAVEFVVPDIGRGNYYVTVFADSQQEIAESNEDNNIGSTYPDPVAITGQDSRILERVLVTGSGEVAEECSEYYRCTAYFTDDSSSDVTAQADWSENSFYATISTAGRLDVRSLSSDRSCTITASYTYSGITKSDSKAVMLRDTAAVLERIEILGPDRLDENSSGYYACIAYFTDDSSSDVTSQAIWSVTTSYAAITSSGRLDVGNLTANRSCAVGATYTYDGTTKTYSKGVELKDVPQVRSIDHVSVSGPSQVSESSTAHYTCTAVFSDSSIADVSAQANWSENSPYAAISADGRLNVGSLTSDRSCTVTATYAHSSGTRSDNMVVLLKNGKSLDHITVSGPDQVDELNSQYYTCTAYFTDGTSSNVSSQVTWAENSPFATITSGGRLDVGNLSSNQSCTITASYSYNGVTQPGRKVVTLRNQDPFVSPTVQTLAAQDVRDDSAVLRARITDDGGSGITTRRFEWGTSQACSDGSPGSVKVSAQGYEFSMEVTNLQPGRTYYFRASAENIAGWGTGSVLSFTTESDPAILPPTVSNWGVQDIGPDMAVIGGYIDDYGGSPVVERRFEWGRTVSCSDGSTSNVEVAGDSFTYTLTGLEPYTNYYYRASARNGAGWGTAGVQELRTDRPPVTAEVEITVTDSGPSFSKGSYSGHPEYWSTDTHEGRTFITAYTRGDSPDCWAEFRPSLPSAGTYSVVALFYGCPTNSPSVYYTVHHSGVQTRVQVTQYFPEFAGKYYTWREVVVGMWEFDGTESERVVVTDATGDAYDGATTLNLVGIRFEKH